MNKRRLIRSTVLNGDIERMMRSGMHLEEDNPFCYKYCEWGLFVDNMIVFDPHNQAQTDDIFHNARAATNGGAVTPISVVPGMHMILGRMAFRSIPAHACRTAKSGRT